ncbi:MAG: beta-lactamase family protein [Gammaproteobacteria bacterium]|nr:beta-lactamase family protein [Gammaproteobacteria bacterium]MBU2185106.1 beta-lactamase family protein [Gammaproteobacteria bacterium]MBU2206974.1 beta-lactamase family protein [Gammaproteobacteria bacterium]
MARYLCTGAGGAAKFKKKALNDVELPRLENLSEWLQQEFGQHAVAIALVSAADVHYKLHGLADVASLQPANRGTLFEIGSVTKPLTALAVLDEVAAGRWRLDVQLAEQFKLPLLATQRYTLADLLSHRSGLPRLPENLPLHDLTNPYAGYGRAELIAALGNSAETQQFAYSNLGYGLLGWLLSESLAQSYAKLMQHKVFHRLNMRTARVPAPAADLLPGLATGYAINAEPVLHWQFDSLAGAGAVVASIEDMAAMLQTIFAKAETDAVLAAWLTPLPLTDLPAMTPGWMLNEQEWLWHAGQTAGFSSLVVFSPKQQKGLVILSNIARPVTEVGMVLFEQWLLSPDKQGATL